MPIHTGRLVLTSTDPHAAPDRDLLIGVLGQAGFIGEPLPSDGEDLAFRVGPEFLDLLIFAGCAVSLPTAPGVEADRAFCHVRLSPLAAQPALVFGGNTRPPRCPACRARLPDWQGRVPGWRARPQSGVTCAACGSTRPPWRWDWKQQGGFGRLFVRVEEVFPGEAVPSARLLDLLTHVGGSGWRHFYVQD